LTLAHTNLFNYYKTNFALKQHHGWSIEDLEDMIPFEREIYVDMLLAFLEEEKQRLQRS
jgi:hypothetical protein